MHFEYDKPITHACMFNVHCKSLQKLQDIYIFLGVCVLPLSLLMLLLLLARLLCFVDCSHPIPNLVRLRSDMLMKLNKEWVYQQTHECRWFAVKTCAFSRSICFLRTTYVTACLKNTKLSCSPIHLQALAFGLPLSILFFSLLHSWFHRSFSRQLAHSLAEFNPVHLFDDCIKSFLPFSGFPFRT